ncbi:hypothetical protein LXM94_02580 [Rhizobium sp. TRM95111]|uniref:hypothetical protein n=1 Tax=Rhizobium alarense TaxID=2846851 RepID=UPI001F326B7C|nr:hypothetical protein [Rhizobium alarense]MCF3638854.1 hypothetical protein [Rhizobium alarense]
MAKFDRNAAHRAIVTLFGGFLGISILASAVILAFIILSTVGAPLWASWSAHTSRLELEKERVARIEKAAQENSFQVVCSDYFEASFLDRWIGGYRRLSWCEDYRDRIPGAS